MMGRTKLFRYGYLLCFLLLCGIIYGKASGNEASEAAKVKAESLTVYARPAVSGEAVKQLKKGAEVYTDLEITGTDGVAWCNVLREWDMATIGYVKCESLERKMPSRQERWRALPSKDDTPPPAKEKPAKPPESQATPGGPARETAAGASAPSPLSPPQ